MDGIEFMARYLTEVRRAKIYQMEQKAKQKNSKQDQDKTNPQK